MKCPVCGNDTFDEKGYEYAICSECFWEYDLIQMENPNFAGGANHSSLNEYRKIYQRLKTEDPGFCCKNKPDMELILTLDRKKR